MTDPTALMREIEMYKVIYDGQAGRVSRTFPNKEKAQEFIDGNALVHPLPGLEVEVWTDCGKWAEDYDSPADLKVNGHYHYRDGCCDLEPSYEMGGPA